MRSRRWLLALMPALAVALAATPARQAPTADAVVEKFLAAIGGRDALGKLTSRRSTGTVSVSSPVGDLPGQIEVDAKPPNKVRVMMTLDLTAVGAGMLPIEQKFDGTHAWMLNAMQGDAEITGTQLEGMRNNMFPTPLLQFKSNGASVEVQSSDQLDGKNVNLLVFTPKVGPPVKLYFDAASGLLVRSITRINSPAVGDLEQTSDLSDYRDVGGVKVPFKVVNANSAQTVTMVFTKIEHNVVLDDAIFAR